MDISAFDFSCPANLVKKAESEEVPYEIFSYLRKKLTECIFK